MCPPEWMHVYHNEGRDVTGCNGGAEYGAAFAGGECNLKRPRLELERGLAEGHFCVDHHRALFNTDLSTRTDGGGAVVFPDCDEVETEFVMRGMHGGTGETLREGPYLWAGGFELGVLRGNLGWV